MLPLDCWDNKQRSAEKPSMNLHVSPGLRWFNAGLAASHAVLNQNCEFKEPK